MGEGMVKLLLLWKKDCPPCEKTKQMLQGLIDAGEIEVVDVEKEGGKIDLAETHPPHVCVFSEKSGKCINDLVISGGSPKLGRLGLRLVEKWVDRMSE